MLYRKQYKAGSIITALMFALYIAYTYVSAVWTNPMIQQLFVQVGADPNAVSISNQQAMAVFQLLAQNRSKCSFSALLLPFWRLC